MAHNHLTDPDSTGDFSCVSQAWHAHWRELHRFIRSRFPTETDADDLLQEVFIKAMRQGQGFCSLTSPRAWLFQVARTTLIDRLRTQRDTSPLNEADPLAAPEPCEPAPVDALTECLISIMADMPADDAAILRACDLQAQTVRSFAEAQGLALAAAKSRLLRARRRLRDRLIIECQVGFDASGAVCCHTPQHRQT